jgi:hypothetical protein
MPTNYKLLFSYFTILFFFEMMEALNDNERNWTAEKPGVYNYNIHKEMSQALETAYNKLV